MCGRYALYGPRSRHRDPAQGEAEPYPTLTDIRPSQQVPALLRECETELIWWFIPAHAKDPDEFRRTYTTFNARVESVAESRLFGPAWRKSRRCAMPMRGYYEWQAVEGRKRKQRHYIAPVDGGLMYAAGLWEQWRPKLDGAALASCTMLIGPPVPSIETIHPRMPVFIPEALLDAWFGCTPEQAMGLLQAAPPPQLSAATVEGPILVDWTDATPTL